MMLPPVWLPGPMSFLSVSGLWSSRGVSVQGGLCPCWNAFLLVFFSLVGYLSARPSPVNTMKTATRLTDTLDYNLTS